MRRLNFFAKAPSNIALIKYMGKTDSSLNLPENASLSMTLDSLCTWVQATPHEGAEIRWVPELPQTSEAAALDVPKLDAKGIEKLVRHIERVRVHAREAFPRFGLALDEAAMKQGLLLRSANSFPPASGIASSASSFAAITLAGVLSCARDPDEFLRAYEGAPELKRALARIARQGSGSSCRSFEGPFVFWENEEARAVDTRMPELSHFVLLISSEEKKVSSSSAHLQIKSSPLWPERKARLSARTARMIDALQSGNIREVALLAWSEAWEMHSLFHTAEEPFSYWQPGTIDALHWLAPFLKLEQPPIVTMDAGPNIHIIVPSSSRDEWRARIQERFPEFKLLEDRPGMGAQGRVIA